MALVVIDAWQAVGGAIVGREHELHNLQGGFNIAEQFAGCAIECAKSAEARGSGFKATAGLSNAPRPR